MDRAKHIERVKALLAKTLDNGCTEQEAAAALAKAKAMIEVYDISDAELELTKQEKAIVNKVALDRHQMAWGMASAVSKFTNTDVWGKKPNRYGAGYLEFCGLPVDVQFAEFLLKHLVDFAEGELVNYLMATPHEARDKRRLINGFALGCSSRISRRLTDLAQPVAQPAGAPGASSSTALVVVQHAAIEAYKAEHNIRVGKGRSSSRQTDHGAYIAGRAAGDRATFARGVTGGAKGYLN